MSKMCDFTAGGIRGDDIRVLVVELKRGAADRDSVRQLQAGLKLIEENVGGSLANVRPEAYLAAGKQTAQLKNLRRRREAYLWFGQSPIELRVGNCGDVVEV